MINGLITWLVFICLVKSGGKDKYRILLIKAKHNHIYWQTPTDEIYKSDPYLKSIKILSSNP